MTPPDFVSTFLKQFGLTFNTDFFVKTFLFRGDIPFNVNQNTIFKHDLHYWYVEQGKPY